MADDARRKDNTDAAPADDAGAAGDAPDAGAAGLDAMPEYLRRCVAEGILEPRIAREVEAFRRRSGVGVSRALRELGVTGVTDAPAEGGAGMTPADGLYVPTLLLTPPDPELTFERYIPCRANSFPLEVARIVAEHGGERSAYSPLYIYSDIGLGKTHLLSAVANATVRHACLVNTADLEVEFERAQRLRQRAELRQFLGSHEILLVDDVQLCEGHENLQRELFALFNQLTRSGRAVVISSDVPPTRLSGVEDRLLSRLGSGVIVGLQMADRAERREMLRQFAQGSALDEPVIDYLAEQVTDSVRRLKAVILQLQVTAERTGVAVDLDLARAVAPMPRDLVAPPQRRGAPAAASPEPPRAAPSPSAGGGGKERFKEMLAGAETEEEQILALQIAVGERLRQLSQDGGDTQVQARLRHSLELLREGQLSEAMQELHVE